MIEREPALIIQKCLLKDLAMLRQLAIKTFVDTYAVYNTPEVMQNYLENAFAEYRLKEELCHPHSEFFLLEIGAQPVGYIKLNEAAAQTESRSDNALELERIYVDRSYQGQGYGKVLLQKAISVARAKQKSCLWLGVWQENPKAIAFYESQGFVKAGTHLFRIGGEDQMDWVMELDLR